MAGRTAIFAIRPPGLPYSIERYLLITTANGSLNEQVTLCVAVPPARIPYTSTFGPVAFRPNHHFAVDNLLSTKPRCQAANHPGDRSRLVHLIDRSGAARNELVACRKRIFRVLHAAGEFIVPPVTLTVSNLFLWNDCSENAPSTAPSTNNTFLW